MNYKQLSLRTIIAIISITIAMCALYATPVLIYDPLQIFYSRPYDIKKLAHYKNMRVQARGIIDNVSFDGIILGSSVLGNTSAIEASKLLGGTFVNLSLGDYNFFERSLVLKYLFKHKNINNVVYSFETNNLIANETTVQHDGWELLYDDNIFNDLYVLYDAKYFSMAHAVRRNTLNNTDVLPYAKGIDKPNEWQSDEKFSRPFGGLQNWVNSLDEKKIADSLLKDLPKKVKMINPLPDSDKKNIDFAPLKRFIDKYFLNFVSQNPNTTFYLVFTPYYRYRYAWMRQVGWNDYFIHAAFIQYLVNKSAEYKNLHIYGFEDEDFVDKIENYRDTIHYHADINNYITKSIAEGKHQLTVENIDAYLEKCEKLALEFDIQKFYDDSQKLLREQGKPTTWEEYQLQLAKGK